MFQNKLAKYFLIWLGAMVLLLAVTFPEHRPVDFTKPSFRVAQPDFLYFKNLRAYYYFENEDEASGYKILKFKSFYKDSSNIPPLTFSIFHNWRQDEAYVMALWRDSVVFNEPLTFQWDSGDESGEISLQEFNSEAHFKFTGELYSHLTANHELKHKGVSIFDTPQKKAAIKTLIDYFKLVGKIY